MVNYVRFRNWPLTIAAVAWKFLQFPALMEIRQYTKILINPFFSLIIILYNNLDNINV